VKSIDAEKILKEQIPLTNALGLKVISLDKSSSRISAPLALNKNHLGTAFGGSLQAVLISAAYTYAYNLVHELGECHIILKEANTKYLLPVDQDFVASCFAPEKEELDKFFEAYKRRGRARIFLKAEIRMNDDVACFFSGEFVAQAK
jgi:thioesterase domain-containing protein